MKFHEDYKKIRVSIQTGDVFATASPALFSRIIRLFTRSKVSHVGLFLRLKDRVFVVEALEGKGVQMIPASQRFKKEKFVFVPTYYKKDEKRLIDDMLNEVGGEYDMKGAVKALFVDTKSNQYFCSELVAKILKLDFSHLKRGVLPSDIITALKS